MFFPISLCGDLLKIFSDSRFICRILGGGNRCDSRADLTSCDVFFFMFLSVCLLGLFEREKNSDSRFICRILGGGNRGDGGGNEMDQWRGR